MTAALALLLAGLAAGLLVPPSGSERLGGLSLRVERRPRRLRRRDPGPAGPVSGSGVPPASPRAPVLLRPMARHSLAGTAGLAVAVMLGGGRGIALGITAAVVLPRLLAKLPDPTVGDRERRIAADLPLGLDLIASCLAAGAPLSVAVHAVSTDLPGPLADVLAGVARQLDLGAPPGVAWGRVASLAPLHALVETVSRVGDSGAALVPALRRLATEERERAAQAQQAAVRRTGVFVVIPLGICFLPAFLLLGVVPIVAGLVGGLSF